MGDSPRALQQHLAGETSLLVVCPEPETAQTAERHMGPLDRICHWHIPDSDLHASLSEARKREDGE